jgi:hypothetical protein
MGPFYSRPSAYRHQQGGDDDDDEETGSSSSSNAEGYTFVEGNGMLVYGDKIWLKGNDNLVIGSAFQVNGNGNMVCGSHGKITGDGNTLNGINTEINGNNNIVIGLGNHLITVGDNLVMETDTIPGMKIASRHVVGVTPREHTMTEIEQVNYTTFGIPYMKRVYVSFPNRPTKREEELDLVTTDEKKACIYCEHFEKCCMIVPCGHRTCCATCANKIEDRCPSCNHIITGIYREYET